MYGESQAELIESILVKLGIEVYYLNDVHTSGSFIQKSINFYKTVKNMDYVYRVFGKPRLDKRFLISKLLKKTTITHWIGTDVLYAQKNRFKIYNIINNMITDINISGSNLLRSELLELGIDSIEIPILPSKDMSTDSKMPDEHSVLVYAPEGKEEFYGMKYIEVLAKRYPNILFNVVGNSNDYLGISNLVFHGILNFDEMEKLYNNITILFRFPEHDGLSLMLLEALAKGKIVIYPYDFPYVNTPISREIIDVVDCFDNIIKNKPILNTDASEYIRNTYTEDQLIKKYNRIFGF